MTDVLAEQNLKLVQDRELNGEAEIREEADPVEEAAKKKKKKKKKGKSATTGEQCWGRIHANWLTQLMLLIIAASR